MEEEVLAEEGACLLFQAEEINHGVGVFFRKIKLYRAVINRYF